MEGYGRKEDLTQGNGYKYVGRVGETQEEKKVCYQRSVTVGHHHHLQGCWGKVMLLRVKELILLVISFYLLTSH